MNMPRSHPQRNNTSHTLTSLGPSQQKRNNSNNQPEEICPSVQSTPAAHIRRKSSPLQSAPMSRADSGFSEGSHRRSTSTTMSESSSSIRQRRHQKSQSVAVNYSPPATHANSHGRRQSIATPPRPIASRAIKSASSTYTRSSAARPSLQSRYTTSNSSQSHYQYFQFPSFSEASPLRQDDDPDSESTQLQTLPPINAARGWTPSPPPSHRQPPPATTFYWTSEETRRLEYATIDAASKGIRGFVTKLVPDCILPKDLRRTRFCNEDGTEDEDDDKGSVRRYRLHIVEDDDAKRARASDEECEESRGHRRRPSGWKRFSFRKSA